MSFDSNPHKRPFPLADALHLDKNIIFSLCSHLKPLEVVRAAQVSREWYHTATPLAYTHIVLHAGSWKSSAALSQTLFHHAHLRHHVQHLTAIHCARYFPHSGNSLYDWVTLLAPGRLRSVRAIGGAALVHSLLSFLVVRAVPRLEALTLFSKTADDAPPHVDVSHTHCSTEHPHTGGPAPDPHSDRFLHDLLPHFRIDWPSSRRSTLHLTLARPASDGGVPLSALYELLRLFHEHLAHANLLCIALGFASSTTQPISRGTDLCEDGLAHLGRQPRRCICRDAPYTFVADVRRNASGACAIVIGGQPFSVVTASAVLACIWAACDGLPVWAHVSVLHVAGVDRGWQVCAVCGIKLYSIYEL